MTIQETGGKLGVDNVSLIALALGTTITGVAAAIPILKSGGIIAKFKAGLALIDAVTSLVAVAGIDVTKLVAELRDLDDEDKLIVCNTFNTACAVANADVEKMIEAVFKSVVEGADFVGELLNAFKSKATVVNPVGHA